MKKSILAILFCSGMIVLLHAGTIYDVKDYGATGKKADLVTEAIQKAIDECTAAGGGTVYFPPGDYLSGTIILKDNVTLYLESSATLWASLDPEVYNKHYDKEFNTEQLSSPVLIFAQGAKNISIKGNGVIHGQARREIRPITYINPFNKKAWDIARDAGVEMKKYFKIDPTTRLIILKECENVRIEDVSLLEGNGWMLHTLWCDRVYIKGLFVYSDLEAGVNSDGIDVDGCTNVTISDCIVETGDDAIVLKTSMKDGKYKNCENVTVTNCVLTSTSSGLKLGTESHGDFKHIVFNNCVIRNSNRGISIVIRDGGTASDVIFSNITIDCNRKLFNWWGDADPIFLTVLKREPDSKVGHIKNVLIENVLATGQGTSKLTGFEGIPMENIRMHNVQLFMDPESWPDKRASHAFEASDVNNLSMTDCEVRWNTEMTEPMWENAYTFSNIRGLRLDKLSGLQAPESDGVMIYMDQVQDAIIERCYAMKGVSTFLKVTGDKSSNIVMNDNYTFYAKKVLQKGSEVSREAVRKFGQ